VAGSRETIEIRQTSRHISYDYRRGASLLFNPYLLVPRASDRVPLGSRECKRKHEGCTNYKVAVDVEGERSGGHAIDSRCIPGPCPPPSPPPGPSITKRPRVYSNCTDTSDLYAPHYQPLENHRLRRGPHVVSVHYPRFHFSKLFTDASLFSPESRTKSSAACKAVPPLFLSFRRAPSTKFALARKEHS